MNIEFFSSTMNDDRISFRITMLTFISNNSLWIEELKDLALKIKIWKYINSHSQIQKSRKEVLLEISHFVIRSAFVSAAVDDLITDQADQSAQAQRLRVAKYFHELSTEQQENYRTSVKEYKRKEKQVIKITQRMLKIDEAIRASVKTYILSKLMFALIKKILQLLIIKYKKIDDQIKKQIHEKFQTLKQSSFKNQIETWVANWKNLKNRILTFDIKNFFDFETMFVEKFLIVDRKRASTFCDNWILQKRTTEKNVHFEKTIREYRNVVKKRLKIVEHVNVVILQNQSQSQSKKSTLSICSDQNENSDKIRQCICECMHDWNKCDHIRKSIKLSNWKCNSQEKKWIRETIKNNRWLYFKIKNMTNIDILDEIKSEDYKKDKKEKIDKKSDNEKKSKDDISNVKFVNMTNLRSFKYASLFINKTFNNSLWRSVIYDWDCNDSFTYDLNRFVNEITFAHELIDTFNDSMMIEKYEIMLVTNHINDKNRRMFFENIAYVSSTDVILMFVTRLKKQDFVWDMYKKALMIKSIDVMICDIEKKHDLSLLKYRFVEKFVNAIQSHKKILAKTTSWNWHLRLEHCRSEMINQLKKIDEIEITQEDASKIVHCDTCAISKMHCLIQRTSSAKATKSFQVLHFDLIICNKAFDDTTCIAHFIDELIFFSWIYSLIDHKKKTLLSVFKDLINQCDRIKFNERAIIRIIRTDQEIFIDKKLEDWVRAQEINWNWSTKNIFEQNEKSERFDELLIEKTRCIKKHAKLSKDFYSECYLVAAHILNRTSTSSLSWDSSLIFMQKLLKESIRNEIIHLKVFDCKTFSLFKETNALKRSEKMKSRAFIEYLIEYDFINIFRVWNSEKDDVNDYRDVIFNETKFFDTYEAVDLFKKEERKSYVTYRAISLQIFENSDEKQYDRISIRKHVLNSLRENVVSKSMMKKEISSSVEAFQLSTSDNTSSFESTSISIFVAVEISKFLSRKETSNKDVKHGNK